MEVPFTGRAIPKHVKDPTSLKEIGLCGPLSTRNVWHSCVSALAVTSKYSPEGPETDKSRANKKRMLQALRVYGRFSAL